MESLFAHVPAPYQEIPTLNLGLACERYQALRTSGMLSVQEKGGQQRAFLLFRDGSLYQAYLQEPDGRFIPVSLLQALEKWTTPSLLVRMVELPSAGVELMRLLLDGTPPTPLLPSIFRLCTVECKAIHRSRACCGSYGSKERVSSC